MQYKMCSCDTGAIDTQAIDCIYFNSETKKTCAVRAENKLVLFNTEQDQPYGTYYIYGTEADENGNLTLENSDDDKDALMNYYNEWKKCDDNSLDTFDRFCDNYEVKDILQYNYKDNEPMYSRNAFVWENENQQKYVSFIVVKNKSYILYNFNQNNKKFEMETLQFGVNSTDTEGADSKYNTPDNSALENNTAENNTDGNNTPDNNVQDNNVQDNNVQDNNAQNNNTNDSSTPDNNSSNNTTLDNSTNIYVDSLPEFTYTGDNGAIKAIIEYFDGKYKYEYLERENSVWIPEYVIYKEETNNEECVIYGNFWAENYIKTGYVLESTAGGERPGRIFLRKNGSEYKVEKCEFAGDGDMYASTLKKICDGDTEIYDKFMEKSDEEREKARQKYISMYVKNSQLDVKYYKDFGWNPVELTFDD